MKLFKITLLIHLHVIEFQGSAFSRTMAMAMDLQKCFDLKIKHLKRMLLYSFNERIKL